MSQKESIVVVGQGYVGTPLTVALAKTGKYDVHGYDILKQRIHELNGNLDSTGEVDSNELRQTTASFTDKPDIISEGDYIIMAIPTPVDDNNNPSYVPLIKASQTVGTFLKKGSIVSYESTVDPGATEEICIPELEKTSQLFAGRDFYVGYSPERINPGDKVHRVDTIMKVVGANDPVTLEKLTSVYDSFMNHKAGGGVHPTNSIKVAEMSKIIENTYRDSNIALTNEVDKICHRLGIDTEEVLEAADTKWNFVRYKPGLVGGHCIGVDPFFLAQRAKKVGVEPRMILGGRDVNETMPYEVVDRFGKQLQREGNLLAGRTVALFGASFKPDVPDMRNSKTPYVAKALEEEWGANVIVSDNHFNVGHRLFEEPLIHFNVSQDEASAADYKLVIQEHTYVMAAIDMNRLGDQVYHLMQNKRLR